MCSWAQGPAVVDSEQLQEAQVINQVDKKFLLMQSGDLLWVRISPIVLPD